MDLNISFKSGKMAKIFNTEKLLIREHGPNQARTIMRRMNVLHAADNLGQVPHDKPERMHQLIGDRKSEFAVDLKHPFRLTFIPNHDPVPLKDDGGYDLAKIDSIQILDMENYH